VILITGASSGIGEAIAQEAIGAGASVFLAARRVDRLEKVKSDLSDRISAENLPGKVSFGKLDVTVASDWESVVAAAIKEFGKIDVLVNNAGVMLLSKVLNLKVDEWIRMVDINIKGVLLGTAAVLPHFKENKSGHILNVSSDADRKVFTGSSVYSATKAAVSAFTQGVRMELAQDGHPIRISSISPGAVKSELGSHITDKEILDGFASGKPFQFMETKDIAEIVVFVLSRPSRVDIDNIMVRSQEQFF
jgi:NADP-dependent 3-hydroxy acid dehydrogenase YdfG